MSRKIPVLFFLLSVGGAAVAADAAAGHQAVSALGRLNGIALHCRYLDRVRDMKAAVIANAPKQRSYGLAFDEATNASFLEQIDRHAPCPGEAGFAAEVTAAVQHLEQVFAGR